MTEDIMEEEEDLDLQEEDRVQERGVEGLGRQIVQ